MGEISVTFEALEAGAAGIRGTYSRLTATLEHLDTGLQPMLAAWTGAAQEAYLVCKRDWDDAAAALAHVLNTIGQAVHDAHQNYTAAESAARANWG